MNPTQLRREQEQFRKVLKQCSKKMTLRSLAISLGVNEVSMWNWLYRKQKRGPDRFTLLKKPKLDEIWRGLK